jgi:hypothetical protein
LAQTAVFLKVKCGKLYDHLEAQMRETGLIEKDEALFAAVTNPKGKTAQYRILSELAMTIADWHKRMAQALIPAKPKVKA